MVDSKTSEQQLQKWAQIFEHAGWGVAMVGATTLNIEAANPAFWRMHGFRDQADSEGRAMLDFFDPSSSESVVRHIEASLKAGHYIYESVHIRKDGSKFPVLTDVTTVFDPTGNPMYRAANFQDISNLKRTEKKLKDSEGQFRSLVEVIPQIVWTASVDGEIEFFNQRWFDYTGISPTEVNRLAVEKSVHVEDFAEFWERWRQSLQTGSAFDSEMRLLRKDLNYRWHLARALPIRDDEGQVVKWFGTYTDIEDQKNAERTLLSARESLEQEVERRTEALRQANTALAAANEELEAFSYSVSHDLRAPLRGIDGFSQALIEDYGSVLDQEGKKYLHFVREGIQKMSELIDDLLDLSRYTRTELKVQRVRLSEVATKINEALRRANPGQSVDLSIQEGLEVMGDAGLLHAALENLFANAWKFASKRAVSKIQFGTSETDGQRVYFVRDNGEGFDMAYSNKLFGAFQRLHSPDEFKGTGIGLATVRRIIHRHGGRVWAEAKWGRGRAFILRLKLPKSKFRASAIERVWVLPSKLSDSVKHGFGKERGALTHP